MEIVAVTHSGIGTEEFLALVKPWIATAKAPRFDRPYPDLVYQPMLEVMKYLREKGYKTYIVTGGGQEFVRVYSEQVYGVPPEQVVGSSIVNTPAARPRGMATLRNQNSFFPSPVLLVESSTAGTRITIRNSTPTAARAILQSVGNIRPIRKKKNDLIRKAIWSCMTRVVCVALNSSPRAPRNKRGTIEEALPIKSDATSTAMAPFPTDSGASAGIIFAYRHDRPVSTGTASERKTVETDTKTAKVTGRSS
jgi:hypothetical protein